MSSSSFAPYQSAHTRAQIVKVLLIVGAGIDLLEVFGAGVSFAFPTITSAEDVGKNIGGAMVVLIRLVLLILSGTVYIGTIVFFLMWLHRSFKNLSAFGASLHHLSYSPGWAVGSFFIPFANLILPYRAVRELWQNSFPSDEHMFSAPSTPIWFPAWWVFWLLCCFAGSAAGRADSMGADFKVVAILVVVSESFTAIAALLAFIVVGEIDQLQERANQKLKLTRFTPPPAPPQHFDLPSVPTDSPQY